VAGPDAIAAGQAVVDAGQLCSWLEKMVRRSRKTFRMSRKIDAARNGAELMSAERRSRWKSNIVRKYPL
jgi:hypothetical protein